MHMNFHLAFEKEGVPEDMRETIFRYGKGERKMDDVVRTFGVVLSSWAVSTGSTVVQYFLRIFSCRPTQRQVGLQLLPLVLSSLFPPWLLRLRLRLLCLATLSLPSLPRTAVPWLVPFGCC